MYGSWFIMSPHVISVHYLLVKLKLEQPNTINKYCNERDVPQVGKQSAGITSRGLVSSYLLWCFPHEVSLQLLFIIHSILSVHDREMRRDMKSGRETRTRTQQAVPKSALPWENITQVPTCADLVLMSFQTDWAIHVYYTEN